VEQLLLLAAHDVHVARCQVPGGGGVAGELPEATAPLSRLWCGSQPTPAELRTFADLRRAGGRLMVVDAAPYLSLCHGDVDNSSEDSAVATWVVSLGSVVGDNAAAASDRVDAAVSLSCLCLRQPTACRVALWDAGSASVAACGLLRDGLSRHHGTDGAMAAAMAGAALTLLHAQLVVVPGDVHAASIAREVGPWAKILLSCGTMPAGVISRAVVVVWSLSESDAAAEPLAQSPVAEALIELVRRRTHDERWELGALAAVNLIAEADLPAVSPTVVQCVARAFRAVLVSADASVFGVRPEPLSLARAIRRLCSSDRGLTYLLRHDLLGLMAGALE
jgi:hypothetical protein